MYTVYSITGEMSSMSNKHLYSPGLHVNLTEGDPVGCRHYKTLTGENGYFRGMFGMREAAARGDISLDEVRMSRVHVARVLLIR